MPTRNDPRELVTILANAECPHCVQATDTLTQWCCEEGLPVAGVDVAHHPEIAQRWDLEHSPAVIYDTGRGARVFPGFPSHAEFLRFTAGR